MTKRPKTIREIQEEKKKKEGDEEEVTITNCSKQLIPIHLDAPKGVDFYLGAQDFRLGPGQSFKFKTTRLRKAQVERLQKQGFIKVLKNKVEEN